MNNNRIFIATIVIACTLGAGISWGSFNLMDDSSLHQKKIAELEEQILDLKFSLAEKENDLVNARSWAMDFLAKSGSNEHKLLEPIESATDIHTAKNTITSAPPLSQLDNSELKFDSQQVLKDLSTTSDRDPRSFSEKVADLLALNPSHENIALASQSIADMADNRESLPDNALQSLYQSQNDPELKRVAAQVLSMRGDNTLIDKQISEAQTGLRSDNAAERQKTLANLAKTRYAGAAAAIAPLLQDADTGVKLDALLALRATGNQTHVHLVEGLLNHPDPSIRWLANDVASNLQNLSDKARTRLASADITAELPVVTAAQ